jgi:hypothetical protein
MTSEVVRLRQVSSRVLHPAARACLSALVLLGHATSGAAQATPGTAPPQTSAAPSVPAVQVPSPAPAVAGQRTPAAEDYRTLVEQALTEFKFRHWQEARVLFGRAHALNPNARTLRGLGVVSFEMREYVAAISYLQQALENLQQPLTETQRTECSGLVERARTYVASVAISPTPADAVLLVDGLTPTRDGEGRILVAFGEHVLSATAPGYRDGAQRVNVLGGERTDLPWALEPAGAAPPGSIGSNGAQVAVPIGTPVPAPAQVALPAAGPQDSPLSNYQKFTELKYTWVAVGSGVVFGAVAVGAYAVGKAKFNDQKTACLEAAGTPSQCVEGELNTDKIVRYQRIANAGIGLASVAAAAAVALAVVEWPREGRELRVAVGPQGLWLRGAF